MRQAHHMTVDRALLLYVLHLAEPHGINGDVKLQQLMFLCELQLFSKGFKGLHFEFFRYAYGAFSKDLDNDLLSLRRRERIENFSLTDKAEDVLKLLPEAVEGVEANEKVIEVVQAVTATYAPQDGSAIVQSVEAVEISSPEQPEFKLAMRDISFHSTLLVPSRIEVQSEFTLSPRMQARLNTALGY
ncbi:MAG: hypothetical protein FJ246_02970 [Nitrospira sp.]|nr:hypothetical protein [Nitrospira sp.]